MTPILTVGLGIWAVAFGFVLGDDRLLLGGFLAVLAGWGAAELRHRARLRRRSRPAWGWDGDPDELVDLSQVTFDWRHEDVA